MRAALAIHTSGAPARLGQQAQEIRRAEPTHEAHLGGWRSSAVVADLCPALAPAPAAPLLLLLQVLKARQQLLGPLNLALKAAKSGGKLLSSAAASDHGAGRAGQAGVASVGEASSPCALRNPHALEPVPCRLF